MSTTVDAGNWKDKIWLHGAAAVPHPCGGYTVSIPIGQGMTARVYSGLFTGKGAARKAARAYNDSHNDQLRNDQHESHHQIEQANGHSGQSRPDRFAHQHRRETQP